MDNTDLLPAKPDRVLSVDALRGFDMFWITGGHGLLIACVSLFVKPMPEWLEYHMYHPAWEGFSAWDLIMPLFLFIVGVAMPFSFSHRLEAGDSRRALYWRIARRVVVLWVLGMIAQGRLLEFDLSRLQFFSNTLQAIAVGYLVAGIALLHLGVLGQVALTVVVLVGYWLCMILVPVPGAGAGVIQENANLALTIDQAILGQFRNESSYTWILSGLGFAGMVLTGVLAGHVLRTAWNGYIKCVALIFMGLGSLAVGWFWADGLEGIGTITLLGEWRFPIIKHLFTSSMVLWAAGWCYLLLAIFYLIIDVFQWRRWAFFFVVIGANCIFAYMIVHIVNFSQISQTLVGGLVGNLSELGEFGESVGSLFQAVVAYSVFWLLLWYMYRNRTLIRV